MFVLLLQTSTFLNPRTFFFLMKKTTEEKRGKTAVGRVGGAGGKNSPLRAIAKLNGSGSRCRRDMTCQV